MKLISITALSMFVGASLFAQTPCERGLNSINKATAEAHVGFLASDLLEGREAGTDGGKIAGEYIVSVLKQNGVEPLFESYFQNFEACNAERSKKGRFQVHPDSIANLKQGTHQSIALRNVLAKIDGKNPNEYVVIGAHYDHIGFDPMLSGDKIYNGADDNASGVSAVLQIARAFKESGAQPERTIIFALWDGEEKGLLGSKYFTQEFEDLGKIKGYLNFDMIGRNNDESNPEYVVYFYTESHPVFEKWLKNDIKKYSLGLKPNYRPWDKPIGGSDNASFAVHDIPVIWYHTDGHPDYHQPGDEASKINWNKLVDITKASYLNMWNLANESKY
jgi:Zn-dependent M28 family amino/carboxypeptidase